MKPSTLAALAAAALTTAALAQTRTDTYDASTARVTSIVVSPLSDGGCELRACGEVSLDDGGATVRECTETVTLRNPTAQLRCAGLAAAALPRVLRALRFDVDGGTP